MKSPDPTAILAVCRMYDYFFAIKLEKQHRLHALLHPSNPNPLHLWNHAHAYRAGSSSKRCSDMASKYDLHLISGCQLVSTLLKPSGRATISQQSNFCLSELMPSRHLDLKQLKHTIFLVLSGLMSQLLVKPSSGTLLLLGCHGSHCSCHLFGGGLCHLRHNLLNAISI